MVVEGKDVAVAAMEVDAFRRLFPMQYIERYLDASLRPDGRPLGRARPTVIALGEVPTADGSALVRLGNTTMLAGVKLEVCVPSMEAPDEGRIAVDFQMPPICSPQIRPGRPAEAACVINEQLSNALNSSELVNWGELSISSGKAAWLAYLDIYCLNADGSLIDAALLASVAALANLEIPAVSVNDDGKVQRISSPDDKEQQMDVDKNGSGGGTDGGILQDQQTLKTKRGLKLGAVPVALTCMLHKKHLLADPTAEEEDVLHTTITVVIDATDRLISMYKPGGSMLATTSTVQDCIALARLRLKEVQQILREALETANTSAIHSALAYGRCYTIQSPPNRLSCFLRKAMRAYNYIHKNGYKSKLIAAAVRNKQDVFSLLGLDYLVVPVKVLQSLKDSKANLEDQYAFAGRLTPAAEFTANESGNWDQVKFVEALGPLAEDFYGPMDWKDMLHRRDRFKSLSQRSGLKSFAYDHL